MGIDNGGPVYVLVGTRFVSYIPQIWNIKDGRHVNIVTTFE